MPAKDKHDKDEPTNPATAAHLPDEDKADEKPKDEPEGHYDDLTDGKAAEVEKASSAPDSDDAPTDEPEAHPAPQYRIEDLLKDKTFDREGKVRSRLAKLSVQGVEYAPADLVAEGRA